MIKMTSTKSFSDDLDQQDPVEKFETKVAHVLIFLLINYKLNFNFVFVILSLKLKKNKINFLIVMPRKKRLRAV